MQEEFTTEFFCFLFCNHPLSIIRCGVFTEFVKIFVNPNEEMASQVIYLFLMVLAQRFRLLLLDGRQR